MIFCKLAPTKSEEAEEPIPQHDPCGKSVELESSNSKLDALRALGAIGFRIVQYTYQESKFRVELIGAPAGLCVDLSSQEYFRFSQAMEAQPEAERKVPEVITTTDQGREENITPLPPAESSKRSTKGRGYLKKLLPMLRTKGRSEKESSHLQMRQRISMFMICLLRLFEKKKKPASSKTESAREDLKVEPGVAVS